MATRHAGASLLTDRAGPMLAIMKKRIFLNFIGENRPDAAGLTKVTEIAA
jgi:hypothetical protein